MADHTICSIAMTLITEHGMFKAFNLATKHLAAHLGDVQDYEFQRWSQVCDYIEVQIEQWLLKQAA